MDEPAYDVLPYILALLAFGYEISELASG